MRRAPIASGLLMPIARPIAIRPIARPIAIHPVGPIAIRPIGLHWAGRVRLLYRRKQPAADRDRRRHPHNAAGPSEHRTARRPRA